MHHTPGSTPGAAMRRLLVAALAAVVAACGGSDAAPAGPPPGGSNPTIGLFVSQPDLTVTQGDVGAATVTVARTNFTGQVALAVDGLPAGVTGTFDPATLDGTATTSTLTLSPPLAAAAGRYPLTVRATGAGVAAATRPLALTVRERPAQQAPVATVTITQFVDTIEAFDELALAVKLEDAQGNTLTGRPVTWTSSDPAVATVGTGGLVTGVTRGTVTFTATSEGKADAASLVVVIRYRQVSTGTAHACDVSSGGKVWCWGLNGNEGRVGSASSGATTFYPTPVAVPVDGKVVQLSTYGRHTCAVTSLGRAWCWGYNGWGSLGDGSNVGSSPVPVAVSGGIVFRSVSAGADHSCGVAVDDRAYCWGHNDWGQLGAASTISTTTPVAVMGNLRFFSIQTGNAFTCGITTTADAWCWGANSIGQLGDGGPISYGNVYKTAPLKVVGGLAFSSVSLGNQYACATTPSGQAYCWGSNNTKFGDGPGGTDKSSPMPVSGGLKFRAIDTGFAHACGVTDVGEVWCWGANGNGQIGIAAPTFSSVPVRAGGSLMAAEVSAAGIATGSGSFTCAISDSRLTVWCWGRNDLGQLGNGTTTIPTASNPVPAIVTGQKPL